MSVLFFGAGLVVLTVATHALGFDALLRVIVRRRALQMSGFGRVTRLVIVLTCWLIVLHLFEIFVWGSFYLWRGCLPDSDSAFYFSGGAYTTAGYGDLVLPSACRMFGPLEALTGILMCGLSAGLFFALVHRWISNWVHGTAAS